MEKTFPVGKDHVEFSPTANKAFKEMETVEPKGDYSGASQKTDPVEIRLVRKLDMRIMVSAFHLINNIKYIDMDKADFMGYVLSQLPRSKCATTSSTQQSGRRPRLEGG